MSISSIYIPNELFFAEVEQQLNNGKKVRIRIRGNSMLPFMRNGDEALLDTPDRKNLRRGMMVVAHTDDQRIVLHRIIRMEGEKITLMGDGNINQYEHTSPQQIIAVVKRFYHGKHEWNPDALWMRVAARIWFALHPHRIYILAAARKIKRLLHA